MAKAIRKTVAVEILLLLEVVAGVVCCHPVRDRIDVQVHFLGGLRLANQHLARWNKAVDKVQFRVVQMKRLAINFPVHIRVGEEDLCRATLRHYCQHPRFLSSLMDWVARIIAALCLRQVFCACTMYCRIVSLRIKSHASSIKKTLKVPSLV